MILKTGFCAAVCAALAAGTGIALGDSSGCLLLRFDDRNFAGWEEALPLFARYDAHATFFVYGKIDARAVSTLRKLQAAGHSLGAHGIRHLKAVDALKKMGERAYFEAEIRPQLVAAEKAGVPLRHFGYPCSQRDAASDALLLTRFDRIAGGGFWPEARAGRIDRCDDLFVPAAEAASRRVWIGSSVGACAPTVTGELVRVVRRLAERNETALFYSHDIVSAEKHAANDISFAELEFLLKTAREAGVRVCGLDELPFDGFRLSRERLFPGFDEKYCKIPLVPEYGARLGNFQTISDGRGESWLITAEWMQPLGCERYGSDNALWLVKLFP